MALCLVAAVPSSKGGYAYGPGLNATVTFARPRSPRLALVALCPLIYERLSHIARCNNLR